MTQASPPAESGLSSAATLGARRRGVLLTCLIAAYALSAIDRQILAVVGEAVKSDLHLTDTELGYLQGVSFALVYALAGIPAGYLADRVSGVRLISIAIGFWSVMVAAHSLVSSFAGMFAVRSALGTGEAVLSPAANVLIGRAFPKAQHARAFSIYVAGGSIGSGLAFYLAGTVLDAMTDLGGLTAPIVGWLAPWKLTFLVFCLPGFAVAALFAALRDPPGPRPDPSQATPRQPLRPFLRAEAATLSFVFLSVGASAFVLSGVAAWVVSFLVRVHHAPLADVGLGLSVAAICGTVTGSLSGGFLSDHLFRHGAHWRLIVCGLAAILGAAAALALAASPESAAAIAAFGAVLFCANLPIGVGSAALQHIAPADARGIMAGLFLCTISLIGSLGPLTIGWVNDHLPQADGIRTSLLVVLPGAFLVSAALYLGGVPSYIRTVRRRALA
jgi:MFS family permease